MITTKSATRYITSPYAGTSFGIPERFSLTATYTDDGTREHVVRVVCTFTSDDEFCDIHDALLDAADDAACADLGPCITLVHETGPEAA